MANLGVRFARLLLADLRWREAAGDSLAGAPASPSPQVLVWSDTQVRCIAGHFMGKKSVTGSPRLESPEEPAVPVVFGPSLRALLEDMMELLTRELLKILLQERLLDENQGKYDLADQVNID